MGRRRPRRCLPHAAGRAAGIMDSHAKLRRVLELCASLGVHTSPRRLGNLWLAPLLRRAAARVWLALVPSLLPP
jgi:hypothetical protein